MQKNLTPSKLQWAPLRVGDIPFIYPLSYYVRALLPRVLGGRPIYESIARCEYYDQEVVFYYLDARASAAYVRGDREKCAEITQLARQAWERWQPGSPFPERPINYPSE